MISSDKIHEKKEIREPVIYNGEPYWLFIKEREVVQDSGRDAKDVVTDPLPSQTETVFY